MSPFGPTGTANNLPLPTGVYHINDSTGGANSNDMADRYWSVTRSTAAPGPPNANSIIRYGWLATERAPGCLCGSGTTIANLNIRINMQPYYQYTDGVGGVHAVWAPRPGSQSTAIINGGTGIFPAPAPVVYQSTVATYTWPVIQGSSNVWALSNTNPNGPLPIDLIDFAAKLLTENDNYYVKLYWSTASEQNNDYFTVERTLDFRTITTVGTVPSFGNSNNVQNYVLNDLAPIAGKVNYYRLMQTDNNGLSTLPLEEKWLPVRIGARDIFNINYVTNAAQLEVMFEYDMTGPVDITVTDLTGRRIYSESAFPASTGLNVLPIDASKWEEGLYIITLRDKDRQVSHKMFY